MMRENTYISTRSTAKNNKNEKKASRKTCCWRVGNVEEWMLNPETFQELETHMM